MDVRTLCMGVLMLGDASGYEIKKHFEEGPFAYIHAAGFGSIYPALNGLLTDGLATCTEHAQDGRPDKKIYAITEAGRRAFRRALHKPPAADAFRSEALFMLFFAELLDSEHGAQVYDDYLATYRGCVERMTPRDLGEIDTPGHRFVHECGLAVYRAVVEHFETHRHILFPNDRPREAAE